MLSLVLAMAAAAADPAKPGWALDGSGTRCTLSRSADAQTLILRTYPGSGNYDLILAGPAIARQFQQRAKAFTLAFAPTGAVFHRTAGGVPLGSLGTAAVFAAFPPDFPAAMAGASSLGLNVDKDVVATFALPIADKAIAALKSCEHAKLQEWGADPSGFEPGATSAKAIGNPSTWLTANDLGKANRDKEGFAIFRLAVAANGIVSGCVPLETNNPAFDTFACPALTARARYEPGRDPTGKPIATVVLYHAEWGCRNCTVVDAIG